ncbi:MAG: hypothetical protein IIC35_08730 [Gemmatimonadetes bacterium]|nr:hypothetical protein [Gemmatimonadota bacterium]
MREATIARKTKETSIEVTLNLDKSEADVTTRGNNGWRAVAAALKDGSVDLSIQLNPDSHADLTAFINAFFNNTQVECAFMDGDVATSGSELAFTVLPPASLAPVESPVAAGLETSPN